MSPQDLLFLSYREINNFRGCSILKYMTRGYECIRIFVVFIYVDIRYGNVIKGKLYLVNYKQLVFLMIYYTSLNFYGVIKTCRDFTNLVHWEIGKINVYGCLLGYVVLFMFLFLRKDRVKKDKLVRVGLLFGQSCVPPDLGKKSSTLDPVGRGRDDIQSRRYNNGSDFKECPE